MNLKKFTAVVLVIMGLSVFGVWCPSWAAVWEQPPLINEYGQVDIKITGLTLADDFQGAASGPITHITLWGAPYNNGGPGPVAITIYIYANNDNLPGNQLWSKTYASGEFSVQQYSSGKTTSAFLDPKDETYEGGQLPLHESYVYQLDFSISANEAFRPEQGQIYWLGVSASEPTSDSTSENYVPVGARNTFSGSRWGNNAVYWDGDSWQTGIGEDLAMRINAAPLPGSLLLLGSGLVGLLGMGLRGRLFKH